MPFQLTSEFSPSGDQPQAITELTEGLRRGDRYQTLLGVTGSGKTFTVSNVIEKLNKPTLVMSHNKTLAAQLYGEFRHFFPKNRVEFFISYYDYYQPEAYIPARDIYIQKDSSVNDEIDRLRLRATSALLSGDPNVIVVASVSCIYGIGAPTEWVDQMVPVKRGQRIDRNAFLRRLLDILYVRNDFEFERGKFRVRGDVVEVYPASADVQRRPSASTENGSSVPRWTSPGRHGVPSLPGSISSRINSRTRSVAPMAFCPWLMISAKELTAPPTKVV